MTSTSASVKVLCVATKQREWSLQSRLADAGKAAGEVALSLQPVSRETELQNQDAKCKRVASLPIQRIRRILEDNAHFMHETREKGKEKRNQAREHKREPYNQLTKLVRPDSHDWHWQPKGKSVQCQNCKVRLTMHSKPHTITNGQQEACPMASGVVLVGGHPPAQDKAAILQQMVDGSLTGMDARNFQVQTNYVVCLRCRPRSAKEKLVDLALATVGT